MPELLDRHDARRLAEHHPAVDQVALRRREVGHVAGLDRHEVIRDEEAKRAAAKTKLDQLQQGGD